MKVSFKYLLALMGALVLGLLFQSGALAATEVRTREDLEAIANNCNGDFVLVADIDLSDAPWEPINWFGGTLDGANHIITGMHIEGSYHDCNIGLFDQVAGNHFAAEHQRFADQRERFRQLRYSGGFRPSQRHMDLRSP